MTDEPPDYDSIEYPDLPKGWSWWSGNVSDGYYTRWFGTDYRMGGALVGKHGLGGYEAEVYWDTGGDHHVAIYPITGIRDDGDSEVAEYATVSRSYDSMQAAIDAVPELIGNL